MMGSGSFHRRLRALFVILVAAAPLAPAAAGEADIVNVEVLAGSGGGHTVHATVRHADEGWDHYADGFDVLAPDGTVLGTRVLAHPHVNAQPFTRSLSGVRIPPGMHAVTIRAHDSVHGHGGAEVTVTVPR